MTIHGLPYQVSQAAGLIDDDGHNRGTVFGEMSDLAHQYGAINLGQGSPSSPAPDFIIDAATKAMRSGANQYAPATGVPTLIDAIVRQRQVSYGHDVSGDHVLVTVGATEALTSAIMALVPRGGTLVTFEPYYDSYAAATQLAGANLVTVPLELVDGQWTPNWAEFDRVIAGGSSVDAVLVNTPHNPTGAVLGENELLRIFDACEAVDAYIITDEVYEYLTFEPARHVSLAALKPDSERVVTVSSAGKTFNVTGWKVGWAVAHPEVREAIQALKQFFTYASGTPLQVAVASALNDHLDFGQANRDELRRGRDLLLDGLRMVPGITATTPLAGYFTIVDFAGVTELEAHEINRRLTAEFGITGIPVNRLCRAGSPVAQRFRSALRLSFCKSESELRDVSQRLEKLAAQLDALK